MKKVKLFQGHGVAVKVSGDTSLMPQMRGKAGRQGGTEVELVLARHMIIHPNRLKWLSSCPSQVNNL